MIYQLTTNSPLANYSYVIVNPKGEAWCVDPYDSQQIESFLENNKLTLKGILNTHGHWDHIRGNEKLSRATNAQVFYHRDLEVEGSYAAQALKDGDEIELSDKQRISVIETPGHTDHCLNFIYHEEKSPKAILSGDTVFNAGVGNCKNGGSVSTLYRSLTEIYTKLPNHLVLYPGHDYRLNNLKFTLSIEPDHSLANKLLQDLESQGENSLNYWPSTLAEEKKYNLFLKYLEEDSCCTLDKKLLTKEQYFRELRLRRDRW
jgi:hydroxyacylglutathione hydrolase